HRRGVWPGPAPLGRVRRYPHGSLHPAAGQRRPRIRRAGRCVLIFRAPIDLERPMEQSWRWFGPDDVVPLHAIRQAGATGVVTALHQIPYGEVWSVETIEQRKALIAADASLGLDWNVVESLPIHERIKLGDGDLSELFDNYRQSMRNLAACGVKTICYNFMPVVDWTRTELGHALPGGGLALRFNAHEYAAFDCF